MSQIKKTMGRFIKNGDPIRKVLNISTFNLAEICESPYTSADNPNANIIHEKLHTPEEIEVGVRLSSEIENVFQPNEERIVIRPLDFTDEWRRQKKRQANRQSRVDEDDDLDIYTQSLNHDDDDEDRIRSPYALDPVVAAPANTAPVTGRSTSAQATTATTTTPTPPVDVAPPTISPLSAEKAAAPAPSQAQSKTPAAPQAPATKNDDFVPYMSPGDVVAVEHISEEELEAIRAAARNEGYRDGFRLGEEKATIEARQKVQAIVTEIGNIIGELQGMQKSILNHAQENFQMICQSLIESLLQREFKMNPETFALVIERAISEALPDDDFKVFVSSSIAKDLNTWQNSALKQHIKADDSLKDFHFRVEGKHASVDADLHKIISELLNQADLNLFDEHERAS
jgi:flagellar biosynthesis/type III secretory pathway protein FliH